MVYVRETCQTHKSNINFPNKISTHRVWHMLEPAIPMKRLSNISCKQQVWDTQKLNILYEFGLGVEQSLKDAAMWYSKSKCEEAGPALTRVIRNQEMSL